MNILVTGGAGYIGSVIVNKLYKNHNITILDDMSGGYKALINKNVKFLKYSIINIRDLDKVFKRNKFDIVIHCAAKINIVESWSKTKLYNTTNANGIINVLKMMKKYNVTNIIFLSTCSVYGEFSGKIFDEETLTLPTNPYGKSKLAAENEIIKSNINYYILRLSNVGGASANYKYGCMKKNTTLLIPIINTKIIKNEIPVVFGNNHPTKDGTCIRDYIHVEDIARFVDTCIKSIISKKTKFGIYNVCSNKCNSVLDVIKLACKINKKPFKYTVLDAREGDSHKVEVSNLKSWTKLKWKPKYKLVHMIKTDYEFRHRTKFVYDK